MRVKNFSPFLNFEATFDEGFDTETKIDVDKVPMEFNSVSKTGLRTQIRQSVLEIYYFFHRNPQTQYSKSL
jgi:hypothetical protein